MRGPRGKRDRDERVVELEDPAFEPLAEAGEAEAEGFEPAEYGEPDEAIPED